MRRLLFALLIVVSACGDDQNEANRRGIGAACNATAQCSEPGQSCLTAFKGGYCGLSGCLHDADCPQGSACVTDDNQTNYCFLICADKPDCNVNRSVDNESSCTSSLTFVDGAKNRKVCRPPNAGI